MSEGQPRELEVKLEGDTDVINALFSLDALAAAIVRSRSQKLVTAYFDTECDALDRAGMTLRVRKTGAHRTMTLKSTSVEQKLFSRGEIEAPVSAESPELRSFDPEIAAMVMDVIGDKPLIRRFETRVSRRLGEILVGSSRIELAVDKGEILFCERSAKICECELELKEGDPAALFTLAAQLTQAGLRLSPSQKSQRGYLLARGEEPKDVRAVEPQFDRDALVEEAIVAIIESSLRHFIGNWPALLDGNLPESIHQMRVALRRLRAALRLFEKAFPGAGFAPFRTDAKRIASALGSAREQDVFTVLVVDGPQRMFPSDESFEVLLSASAARRSHEYEIVRQFIRASETSRFVLELQAFVASRGWRNKLGIEELSKLGKPARSFAAEAIERNYQRACRSGKSLMELEPEQRHRLRINLKNLRYVSDFFGSLFDDPRSVRKFSKTVRVLQDSLGANNDAVAALKTVRDLEQSVSPPGCRAAGIVLGWCGREASSPDVSLRDKWLAFRKAHGFWK